MTTSKVQPIQAAFAPNPSNRLANDFKAALRKEFRTEYRIGKTNENREFTVFLVGQIMTGWKGQPMTGYEVYLGSTHVITVANTDQLNLFLAFAKWQLT
jgi:hypothetical protein